MISIYKKIGVRYLALMALLAVSYGCVDLDEDPTEALLSPEVMTSPEALDAAIVGVYRSIQNYANASTFYIAGYGGDDITTHPGRNKAGFRAFDKRTVVPTTERLNDCWNGYYEPVRALNNIIEQKDAIEGGNVDDINIRIGEAYFMRGMLYMFLTRTFGKVPLSLSALPDLNLELSEIEDVYKQIEADFTQAATLLPDLHPESVGVGARANKGTANAFLARLYLYWAGYPLKDNSKYALAASMAKSVIDNAGAHDFMMVDDMLTLWSQEDANRFNTEGVFTLVFCQPCDDQFSNRAVGRVGYPINAQGWNETFAEIKFMNDMPAGPRKDATFKESLTMQNGSTLHYTSFQELQQPMIVKVTGLESEIPAWSRNTTTNVNRYFMRYAEVLLIYAEATGRAGGNDAAAWDALNQVRRRALGHLPYTATYPDDLTAADGTLADLAFTERKWELAGEFERWYDLVRMEQVQTALSDRSSLESNPIEGSLGLDNYFAPIPQEEIDKAPHLANSN